MGAAERYARISPKLAHLPGSALSTRMHAWILRHSRGRVAGTLFGSPLLVLKTVGRRSGQVRESPLIYLEDDGRYVVVAANAASERPPAWWLNLEASASCEALVAGRWQ